MACATGTLLRRLAHTGSTFHHPIRFSFPRPSSALPRPVRGLPPRPIPGSETRMLAARNAPLQRVSLETPTNRARLPTNAPAPHFSPALRDLATETTQAADRPTLGHAPLCPSSWKHASIPLPPPCQAKSCPRGTRSPRPGTKRGRCVHPFLWRAMHREASCCFTGMEHSPTRISPPLSPPGPSRHLP